MEVAGDPRTWAEARGELHWAAMVAPKERKSIQGWASPGEMLRAMDEAEVEQAVLLGWYWEKEASCLWHNSVMADWLTEAPDRFIAFASILPNENTLEQLEAAHALGFKGVGELHPGVQQFDSTHPAWQALAEWCAARNWPVNLHATEAVGHDLPDATPTPLDDFLRMARRSPDLKLILAHWGGGLPFFEQNPRLKPDLRNVYYDTSASPLLYEPAIFRHMVNMVGADKILYGSDYPLRIYPRSKAGPDFKRFIKSIREDCGLSEPELEKILSGNIRAVLTAN